MKKINDTIRRGLLAATFLTAALLVARPAAADPLTFSFLLNPANGSIAGAPGSTIGWGYTIGNETDAWLELFDFSSGSVEQASLDSSLFDYPILAPHTTWTMPFTAATSGLAQLTWDPTAPVGFVNSGVFVLTAHFWDGDPFGIANVLETATQTALYNAAVTAPSTPTPVPEPATLLLTGAGFAAASLMRKRRRNAQPAS